MLLLVNVAGQRTPVLLGWLPVVASAVTSPELSGSSPNFFRTAFTDAYQGEAAGRYVAEQGVGSVAVMYQQDDYGQGVAEAFTKS